MLTMQNSQTSLGTRRRANSRFIDVLSIHHGRVQHLFIITIQATHLLASGAVFRHIRTFEP